ncbi:MAG TPA: hypothetical protein VGF67_18100 [Ktedonobacteraceae bacterium]
MSFLDHNLLIFAQQAPLAERQLAVRSYQGQSAGPGVMEISGHTPITLSSPHITNPPRGQTGLADMSTGALAIQLAGLIGASAASSTQTTDEAPNYDTDRDFKRQLRSLVASTWVDFVPDQHGMSQQRSADFESGAACGATPGQRPILLTIFIETLTKAGSANVSRDRPFPTARSTTIASFPWRTCQVPAIRQEIRKRSCDPARDPLPYAVLLSLLCEALHILQQWL